MNENPSPDLIEKVCAFVARETSCPVYKIKAHSRLEADMGITGDDASDLLEHFAQQFGVDFNGFVFSDHFSSEGNMLFIAPAFLLIRLVPSYRRRVEERKSQDITISHLAQCAHIGHWFRPAKEPSRPEPKAGLAHIGCVGLVFIFSGAVFFGPLALAIWLTSTGKPVVAILMLVIFAAMIWMTNRVVSDDLPAPPAD